MFGLQSDVYKLVVIFVFIVFNVEFKPLIQKKVSRTVSKNILHYQRPPPATHFNVGLSLAFRAASYRYTSATKSG